MVVCQLFSAACPQILFVSWCILHNNSRPRDSNTHGCNNIWNMGHGNSRNYDNDRDHNNHNCNNPNHKRDHRKRDRNTPDNRNGKNSRESTSKDCDDRSCCRGCIRTINYCLKIPGRRLGIPGCILKDRESPTYSFRRIRPVLYIGWYPVPNNILHGIQVPPILYSNRIKVRCRVLKVRF